MHEEYSVFKLPEMMDEDGSLAAGLQRATEKDTATDDSLAVYEELTAIAEEIEKCRGRVLMI